MTNDIMECNAKYSEPYLQQFLLLSQSWLCSETVLKLIRAKKGTKITTCCIYIRNSCILKNRIIALTVG